MFFSTGRKTRRTRSIIRCHQWCRKPFGRNHALGPPFRCPGGNSPHYIPKLRAVRIVKALGNFEDSDGPVGWNGGGIFLKGPALRNLDFGYATTLLSDMRIVWDCITTVTMADISVADAVDILRQAPCLTSCSFTLDRMNGNVEFPKVPVVNSALKVLHVGSDDRCDETVVSTFTNNVTLPSLQELSLQTSTSPPNREFKSFFERSRVAFECSLSFWRGASPTATSSSY